MAKQLNMLREFQNPMGSVLRYGFENSMSDLLREFSGGSKIKKIIKEDDKIHPFFEKCLEYIDKDDIERVEFFQNAVKDKFPKHFKYNKSANILAYRCKKTKENIKLPADAKNAAEMIIDFFHNVVRSFSRKDIEKTKKIITKKSKDVKTWNKIKNQKQKDVLIQKYAQKTFKEKGLDYKFYLKIKHIIYNGMLLDKIKNDDVVMKNGNIESIKPLKWNGKNFYLDLNLKVSPKKIKDKFPDSFYLSQTQSFLDFNCNFINLEKKTKAHIKMYIKVNV